MAKTFRFVGVSTLNGITAVRYANQASRAAHLTRVGHQSVMLWDMGESLHQMDLVDALLDQLDAGSVAGPAVAAVLTEARRLGFAV